MVACGQFLIRDIWSESVLRSEIGGKKGKVFSFTGLNWPRGWIEV
jgi:hypothetical protein